ncbi:BglG family transcription antiterminator [Facklamia sp. P12934]|uniref:BglG family transcription antiterminator n=1 Tax=Facklamia sp. P12934 TaxID=3421948 RepID=UPI003D1807E8
MSPKERRLKMFEYLKLLNDWVTVEELSENFNVSPRTIYNDLEVSASDMIGSKWVIEKKRGVGVRLNLLNKTNQVKNKIEIIDLYDRKTRILELFLVKDEKISLENIANKMYVSISSIKNDIKTIQKLLDKNTNLKLVSSQNGTKLVGNETDFRESLIWFNQYVIETQQTFGNNDINHNKLMFKRFYSETLVGVALDVLFEFVKNKNNLLSDHYLLNILNVYIVQLHRLLLNKKLENNEKIGLNVEMLKELHTLEEFTTGSRELLSRAAARLSFEFSENEVNYLAKYLILYRLEKIPVESENYQLIEDLICHLSQTLRIDLNEDMQLKKELMQHVPPMIYRLKLNIKSENPFTNQIISEFGETFHIIKLAIACFETRLNLEFNDEELGLLTIYFQSAIERKKQNQSILVICQYGLAMSKLLVNRLKNSIPLKLNVKSCSVGELDYLNLDSYDLIISTLDSLELENVLKVSTFLNENDTNKIICRLSKLSKEEYHIQTPNEKFLKYVNPKYIIVNETFENKYTLLNNVMKQLLNENYIQKEFINSLLNREKIGSTDLQNGVAIPHGSSEFVNKTLVVIIKSKNKIKWNDFFVDKIFIPLIDSKDIPFVNEIIKEIYNWIDNEDVLAHFANYLINIKERLN